MLIHALSLSEPGSDESPSREIGNLILTRLANQSVLIGDDIRITVYEAKPGRVQLSIQAPKSVRVLREEVQGL